jgi:hypothetical protein
MVKLEEQIVLNRFEKQPGHALIDNIGISTLAMKSALETVPGNIGLIGGKLFTLNYSFMGQVTELIGLN